jgi:serine/threonine-protein kinase
LKPSNIIVSSDFGLKNIKLTDFGISKLAEKEMAIEMQRFELDESTLTQSNTLLGAIPYMAPECWANWRDAGQPMDIWALGCIGYQLLTGELPFGSGRNAIVNLVRVEQTGQINIHPPKWFGKHPNTHKIEQELWEIIISCITIDPATRPTARDIIQRCNLLTYPAHERQIGTINRYRMGYSGGGTSSTGVINPPNDISKSWFFHASEHYGNVGPAVGQRVCFSIYPGHPNDRASPVLLLR